MSASDWSSSSLDAGRAGHRIPRPVCVCVCRYVERGGKGEIQEAEGGQGDARGYGNLSPICKMHTHALAPTICLARLGDDVEMHVPHLLVGQGAIVLQDIVVLRSQGCRYPPHDGEEVGQRGVRQLVQPGRVHLGDDQGVALGQGLDVEEGQGRLRLQDLAGGDGALDDLWCLPGECAGGPRVRKRVSR
jgi:hypothetical protein